MLNLSVTFYKKVEAALDVQDYLNAASFMRSLIKA